ncbi:beta-lactamase/transpeptidase-like protein [Aspergillus pseudotamarii]|uniref:Beta-lactamase/transpeptidase-like protein n=1 Tax=Aspergillus pseudotamarii TaxID=132259 RepID=A0A5N6TBD7_ASPPS|nr:beta-lactamase/transpeptidase-like protein [Aspergillus pseudotamarii]KAE8143622.1 beta-lactamase/transpeptidase-like protein [Aspergillus pseudotamarii]
MVLLYSARAHQLLRIVSFLLFTLVYAQDSCPLQTPLYPPPRDLLSSQDVKAASENLTQAIEEALTTGLTDLGSLPLNTTTFAVKVFSSHTEGSLYEYLYTSPTYSPRLGAGAQNTTLDSVYRVASISKLLTVLTLLAHDGYTHWNHPITTFIPDLDIIARNQSSRVQWQDITIGDLAAQLSGVPHDYAFEDLAGQYSNEQMMAMGLPAVPAKDIPTCNQGEAVNGGSPCDREAFLRGIVSENPTFAPGTTPAYSNAAYQLLRYAMENITGTDFPSMFENSIVKPLSLNSTSLLVPKNANVGIIPLNQTASVWDFDLGDGDAFGGAYSSANDLAVIGRSILQSLSDSSALNISSTLTRHWLKPLSHTTSFQTSVGAPWEIFRYELPNRPNHVIDVYSKSGNLGAYADIIALIPEYEIGFSITAADLPTNPLPNVWGLADLIIDRLSPAFDKAAQQEANCTYAGTYKAQGANSTTDSYVTITTDHQKPGLLVTKWVSNGVDFLQSLVALSGFEGLAVRLYPTGIEESVPGKSANRVFFRGVFDYDTSGQSRGVISACQSWLNVDASRVGNIGVDEWVFTLDKGKASSAEPRLMRKQLRRV